LPKGVNRGEKQLQTAAERGFAHLMGGAAPPDDIDDDGDEDNPEFGESGGRQGPGMEMDHHPLPTDRGPKTPTGNKVVDAILNGKKHDYEMGEEDEGGEAENCAMNDLEGAKEAREAKSTGGKLNRLPGLEDNILGPPVPDAAEEPSGGGSSGGGSSGGTGMAGSPIHIGPTAPTGNAWSDAAREAALAARQATMKSTDYGIGKDAAVKLSSTSHAAVKAGEAGNQQKAMDLHERAASLHSAVAAKAEARNDHRLASVHREAAEKHSNAASHYETPTGNKKVKTRFFLTANGPFGDMSHDDIRGHVQGQLAAKTGQDKPAPMLHSVSDDHVIYHDGDQHQQQAIAPDDQGKPKLTGKPVPVKPVTKFEPVSNREGPMVLTAQQRQQAVGWLTTNCDCHKGKEKVLLNKENYSDDDIVKLLKMEVRNQKNEAMVSNARRAGIALNDKVESSSADATGTDGKGTEVNDSKNKEEGEDEEPMFKKDGIQLKGFTGNQLIEALAKELGRPVAAVRNAIMGGADATVGRRAHLIKLLTANHRNPATKAEAVKVFNTLDNAQLEIMAAGLPSVSRPLANQHQMGRQPQQQARPIFGPEIDVEVLNGQQEEVTENAGPDILPMPSWNEMRRQELAANQTKQRA
jgi:hypothetical protein